MEQTFASHMNFQSEAIIVVTNNQFPFIEEILL